LIVPEASAFPRDEGEGIDLNGVDSVSVSVGRRESPSATIIFLPAPQIRARWLPDYFRIADKPSGIMDETNWDHARCPLSGVPLQ